MTNTSLTAELRCPWVRDQVIVLLRELSDLDRQKREWFHPSPDRVTGFDEVVHFFFDDNDFETPEREVGISLYPGEDTPIKSLRDLLNRIIADAPDLQEPASSVAALGHELWPQVVRDAKSALDLFEKHQGLR